jgi:hypothetical protein
MKSSRSARKSFGSCSRFNDKPVNIPADGLVKFDLVGVHNAAHYSIKVLKYLSLGDTQ